MADFIDVNLTDIDVSFRVPPVGNYLSIIEDYEIRKNSDKSLWDIKFVHRLLAGNEEGVDLIVYDYINPNNEIGCRKLRLLADTCAVEYTEKGVDISNFRGQKLGVQIIHKPGSEKGIIFANIKRYFVPDLEEDTAVPF